MATEPTQAGAQIEPRDGLSHVRGATDIALSDATVSRFLLETANRFPERPAVVFREQNIRWTWREFANQVDVLASGLARAWHSGGRSRRHLVAEPSRMAAHAVRHRAHRRGAGQHQSGVPAVRARIRAEQGRAARRSSRLSSSSRRSIWRCCRRSRPNSPTPSRTRSTPRSCRNCALVIRMGDGRRPACSTSTM